MRRCCLGLLVVLALACSASHPLVGNWHGEDSEGHQAMLMILSTGRFEAVARGETLKGTWELNEDLEPARLTLSFDEGKPLVTIVKLQGDKLLIEPPGEEGAVPRSFSDKATVYLRQK